MTFTVEIKSVDQPDRCEVELYLDREAVEDLIKQLSFLKSKGDHAHFFTPSWGGMPLTEGKQQEENTLVNHLRITVT
jgi:Immunity protein 32